ncbi:MAG TPA: Nif3-like dinuclear metal center hexameric protein [Verrucomicrobiales bacterium]|nr:Nif3-like dinuclear metal center hexameric protein [Verrucomicrobiales bacterium]
MARLTSIVAYLDRYLKLDEIPDYDGAWNGLQMENEGEVRVIAAAVDATLPVIEDAVKAGAGMLLAHHGLFWEGVRPVRGAFYRKLRLCLVEGLAVYSAHLPLDVHPRVGNNALLAAALGMTKCEPFLDWKGIQIGLKARVTGSREALVENVRAAVGGGAVRVIAGGADRAGMVGVITGGAGGKVAEAAAAGIDTFVTGEGPHHTAGAAEELGINVIYAGHYATETFGVRALADHLAKRFKIRHLFVDHPSGL